jgi:hypothetical protein
MRAEKKRVQRALNATYKIDPRGMWTETYDVVDTFIEMIKACEYVETELQREMMKRMRE